MEKEKGLANKAFFNRILAERGGLVLLSATPSIHAGFRGAACKMFPAFVPRNMMLESYSEPTRNGMQGGNIWRKFSRGLPLLLPREIPPVG